MKCNPKICSKYSSLFFFYFRFLYSHRSTFQKKNFYVTSSIDKNFCHWIQWYLILFFPAEQKKRKRTNIIADPHLSLSLSFLFFSPSLYTPSHMYVGVVATRVCTRAILLHFFFRLQYEYSWISRHIRSFLILFFMCVCVCIYVRWLIDHCLVLNVFFFSFVEWWCFKRKRKEIWMKIKKIHH